MKENKCVVYFSVAFFLHSRYVNLHFPHTKRLQLVELGSSVHVSSDNDKGDYIGVVEEVWTEISAR